jgi:hypothetical protein
MKKAILIILTVLLSCQATKTALFDQYSYQKTTELKVETVNLIDKSTTAFADNKVAVEKLHLDIEKLIEYEKNKPNNELTFAMWQILNDKEKNLLAGFFKRWEQKGTMSAIFVSEAKKQIIEGMDLLIQFEIKKDQTSKDNLLNFINLNK